MGSWGSQRFTRFGHRIQDRFLLIRIFYDDRLYHLLESLFFILKRAVEEFRPNVIYCYFQQLLGLTTDFLTFISQTVQNGLDEQWLIRFAVAVEVWKDKIEHRTSHLRTFFLQIGAHAWNYLIRADCKRKLFQSRKSFVLDSGLFFAEVWNERH